MAAEWSRRRFISSAPLLAASSIAAGSVKYRDPATEFEVVRLTATDHVSVLPPGHLRPLSPRNNTLLYCSDEGNGYRPCRLDLKSGDSVVLADANNVDPQTVSFVSTDRTACYFEGNQLMLLFGVTRGKPGPAHAIYEVPDGWQRARGFCVSGDGNHAVLVESGKTNRIRLVPMKGTVVTVVESDASISDVMTRPRRAGIAYRRNAGIWLVNYDGQQNRPLKTAPGNIGPFLWNSDGRTLLYLRNPPDNPRKSELRENTPDTNEDKLVANTTQFVNFAQNADSTVFAGLSGSIVSPHVLLLLRVTKREMTVCEHRASDPSKSSILFSPNSQRVYFNSDRDGKTAIYSVNVEKFVEETGEEQ